MTDILDRIDAIVAEETCGHCGRQWHDKPLTQAVARMFDNGRLDPNYFNGGDVSPIVCEGSYLIGPRRPEPQAPVYPQWTYVGNTQWIDGLIKSTIEYTTTQLAQTFIGTSASLKLWTNTWDHVGFFGNGYSMSGPFSFDEWYSKPTPLRPCDVDVIVEFGPQHWIRTETVGAIPADLPGHVGSRWNQFRDEPIPTPATPGYDFSKVRH